MMLQTCSTRTWRTQTWPILRRLAFVLTASAAAAWPIAAGAQVTVAVDAAANRRPINPNVYGVAHAGTAELSDLNVPLNRHGGNPTTRVNWQINADNRGNDWYYESVPGSSATPGEMGDTFITNARAAGAQAMITIPTIDWVAKLGPNRSKLASFSIAKYGPQTGNDWQWFADAGNGIRTNGQLVTGNDPNDANVRSSVGLPAGVGAAPGRPLGHERRRRPALLRARQRAQHLARDAPRRPSDRRDHGRGPDEERRLRHRDQDRRRRARSSSAPRNGAGPATSTAATTSSTAASTAGARCPIASTTAARTTCRGSSDTMRQRSTAAGRRLLDVFTVHYYPQGGEFSDDVSTAMQQRRNRSTRSLWDPNYVDETWINDRVRLIPRLAAG